MSETLTNPPKPPSLVGSKCTVKGVEGPIMCIVNERMTEGVRTVDVLWFVSGSAHLLGLPIEAVDVLNDSNKKPVNTRSKGKIRGNTSCNEPSELRELLHA